MIVKMKKLTLLCLASEKKQTLDAVRQFGELHVDHIQKPEGHDLEALRLKHAHIQQVLETWPKVAADSSATMTADRVLSRVKEIQARKASAESEIEDLKGQIKMITPFGNFDPHTARRLDQFQGLYKTAPKQLIPEIEDGFAQVCNEVGGTKYFAVISTKQQVIDAVSIPLPDLSLAEMRKAQTHCEAELVECGASVTKLAAQRPVLEAEAARLVNAFELCSVSKGMGSESVVAVLKGFFPAECETEITKLAKENGWGFVMEEPSDEDAVPTLLRNPKWVDLIKPVFGVIGVLPGYKELDVSALFLIFLSIFFAFLIGDAGYGALFIGISLFFKGKLKGNAEAQNGLNLMVLMSACTVIWGILTGTYFGIRPEFLPAALTGCVPAFLSGPEASNNIMLICFTIGAIHLTIAHLWNFVRKINSISCVGDLGWTCCTWALYFIVLKLVVGTEYPFAASILQSVLGLGVVLIVVSILAAKAYFGFVTLALDVINNFVDIISYVRLFAVGAASLAVAVAFNDMAMASGFHGVAAIGSALILFLGHGLNIILGAMGILVHGIRLNTLEFSGHAGVEWGGEKFAPFKSK